MLYTIKDRFQSFQSVPAGPHYVGAIYNSKQYGLWCYLQSNSTIVKVFNSSAQTFRDDTPENIAHYDRLVRSGTMGSVLISYNPQALAVWTGLTNHLKPESFPRTLNPIPGSVSNRFDYDFNTVHSGQTASFLAEFQFPFASWYTNPTNPIPLKHWVHLVQAVYNAGERNMVNNPDLFTSLVETMLAQFELISDGEFNPQSVIGFGAKNLSEDLIDTEIEPLLTKGRAFEAYLPTRGL